MDKTMTKMYWSRKPGDFVHKFTGKPVEGASFTGTTEEWYETLVETIIDVIHTRERHTPEAEHKFIIVASPDAAKILQSSILFKVDLNGKQIGTLWKMKVYESLTQLRNVIEVFDSEIDNRGYVEILQMDFGFKKKLDEV